MEWMTLSSKYTRVLQHHLHTRVVRQHHRSSPVAHHRIVRRRSSVIKRRLRIGRKVSGVNSFRLSIKVCLKKRRRWKHKGKVVHRSCEFLAIGSLARGVYRTRVRPKSDGKEELPVYRLRNVRRKLVAGQAAEFSGQVGDELSNVDESGGVDGRERGF